MSKQSIHFVDEVLGQFVASPPQRRTSSWRNWSGTLSRGEHRINLGLGGDAKGPSSWLLDELRVVVAHFDEIVARAASALAECAPEYKISDFRPESISVWDDVDCMFEITFEPLDREARANVETHWPAGRVVRHLIVIARDYKAVRIGGKLRLRPPKVPADYPDPKPT